METTFEECYETSFFSMHQRVELWTPRNFEVDRLNFYFGEILHSFFGLTDSGKRMRGKELNYLYSIQVLDFEVDRLDFCLGRSFISF